MLNPDTQRTIDQQADDYLSAIADKERQDDYALIAGLEGWEPEVPISDHAGAPGTKKGQPKPEPEELDHAILRPETSDGMFYGLAGEVGRAAANGTEVPPQAAMLAWLVMISSECSGRIALHVGDTLHYPLIYGAHVGRSNSGRKGDSYSLVSRIRAKVQLLPLYDGLLGHIHTGGLSSREGLIFMIHDGYTEGKRQIEPVLDKRLFILESEFANVLEQCKREGNTLSSALRDSYDGRSIYPATKHNRMGCHKPRISLLGHITPSELLETIQKKELSNGFANRFIFCFAERDKIVPFPDPTDKDKLLDLAIRTAKVIKFAKNDYPNNDQLAYASLSPAARAAYIPIYNHYAKASGSILDDLLARRPSNLLRLALLFALTDKTTIIDVRHIEAAKAWIDYSEESVRYLFRVESEKSAAKQEVKDNAIRILKFLRKIPGPGLSKTQILSDVFGRNLPAKKLTSALQFLLDLSPPLIGICETPNQTAGPKHRLYYVKSNGVKQ